MGGWSSQAVVAKRLVGIEFEINEFGAFFYSGPPALGNLVISLAPSAGADDFGNPYGAGINIGDQSGAHAGIDDSGRIFLFNSADEQIFELSGASGGIVAKDTSGNVQAVFSGGSAPFGLIGPAVAFHPGTTIPETWQPIILDSGWILNASYAAPSYMLLPDGRLALTGLADSGSNQTANKTLNNSNPLSLVYRPKTTKVFRSFSGPGGRGAVQISNAGVITMLASATYPAQYCEIDATLPLNL